MQFTVSLCYDVFFNVLQYGRRRQLAMIEPIGRRFRRVIDGKFLEAPLLFLDIELRLSSFINTNQQFLIFMQIVGQMK